MKCPICGASLNRIKKVFVCPDCGYVEIPNEQVGQDEKKLCVACRKKMIPKGEPKLIEKEGHWKCEHCGDEF